jgi:hypothetical protein
VVAGQQLDHVVAEFVSGKQALDVRRREIAKWPRQHGGLGQRGARVRRRAFHNPCDLFIGEAMALEAGCRHERGLPTAAPKYFDTRPRAWSSVSRTGTM